MLSILGLPRDQTSLWGFRLVPYIFPNTDFNLTIWEILSMAVARGVQGVGKWMKINCKTTWSVTCKSGLFAVFSALGLRLIMAQYSIQIL